MTSFKCFQHLTEYFRPNDQFKYQMSANGGSPVHWTPGLTQHEVTYHNIICIYIAGFRLAVSFDILFKTWTYLDSVHVLWNIILVPYSVPVTRHLMNFSPWSFKTLSQIIQIIWNLLNDDWFSWDLLGWWFVWPWWMLVLAFLNKICLHTSLKISLPLLDYRCNPMQSAEWISLINWSKIATSWRKLTVDFNSHPMQSAGAISLINWSKIATNWSKITTSWRKYRTCRHLMIRHFWHLCLIPALNKSQFPFPSLQVYSRPLMIVRRKKPLHPSQLN